MSRYILKTLVFNSLFLFSCTSETDHGNFLKKGDEWNVQDFSVEVYPSIIPFEKNSLIYCLEEELLNWRVVSEDTLIVSNLDEQVLYHYRIDADTMALENGNNGSFKIVFRKVSDDELKVKLIGLWCAELTLQKQYSGQ